MECIQKIVGIGTGQKKTHGLDELNEAWCWLLFLFFLFIYLSGTQHNATNSAA